MRKVVNETRLCHKFL